MERLAGHITIAAVGKLKSLQYRFIQDDFLKRLGRYTDVQLVEVKDVVGKGLPDDMAMQKEGQALLKATESAGRRIILTSTGRLFDSLELAEFVRNQIGVYGRIAFLIGGPVGLSLEVRQNCQESLSLSRLTFPHEIARLLLLEQLYRAGTIIAGESYHK
ncbi:MAG: 23S rRNA (pseudouridine(1915)-N(3))-methyltransferase RlmH [Chloroflexi bacterium]|nr:23S rRNA (pseudouridine(1915)-N(3))-methyltransferase RlmH [Ardenticatenaceae bacterium]MBL1130880.1 23S rRNA (pseudouridine(1915)-N(3))-methyltransferase RlmH [Chloroflexota bacterium]NOG36979.1 23S rRNA (pseudouridine(1915)-N(3))-methyltransferase RlmH [Chloroflexota bacterium]GIK56839.1 MAG: ribosomal RNA large subunit methyltransferase H [Chloroflexota bacterium]